jgi:hypothetical protein
VGRRYLPAIGKAGLKPRPGLAVDDRNLMTCTIEEISRSNADDTGTEDENFHGADLIVLDLFRPVLFLWVWAVL